MGGLGERLLPRVEEVRVRAFAAAAHPAADLVQLGEAEQVGPLDDEGVGVRDVDAGLDDGRADQHVEVLLPEADHHLLQRFLAHLAVRHRDPRLGHQLAQPAGRLVDRLDPVVQEEDLAVAQQLAVDGRGDLLVVVATHVRQHRVPLLRRGGDGGHLPDAGDRHLQGPRDRRGRHGQHVDRRAQRLQVFLVLDAEALLLVDDHHAQRLEPGGGLQQPVGADDDVGAAVAGGLQGLGGLLRRLEARQLPDLHRELAHPLGEGVVVLLGEQRGGDQDGHLLAVLHRLERRPYRDLGLAVADVAADQPVHRDRLFHVPLDLLDRRQLIRRLRVRERVLQLTLPRGVRAERVPLGRLPGGVELDELCGDLPNRLLRAGLRLLPLRAAHLVQGGRLPADVAGELVELVGGHVEPVAGLAALAGGVLQDEVFPVGAVDGALHQLDVAADAVLLVHHVVAGLELQRVDGVAPPAGHLAHVLGGRAAPAGDVVAGDDREPGALVDEAVVEPATGDQELARLDGGRYGVDRGDAEAGVAQQLGGPLGGAVAFEDQRDRPLLTGPPVQVGGELGGVAVVERDGLGVQGDGVAEVG